MLVLRVFLLPMWKGSIGMGLYIEKWYSEPVMCGREITEKSA